MDMKKQLEEAVLQLETLVKKLVMNDKAVVYVYLTVNSGDSVVDRFDNEEQRLIKRKLDTNGIEWKMSEGLTSIYERLDFEITKRAKVSIDCEVNEKMRKVRERERLEERMKKLTKEIDELEMKDREAEEMMREDIHSEEVISSFNLKRGEYL